MRSVRTAGRDLRDAALGLLPTAAALLVAAWLLDGLLLDPWWTALAVALLVAAADAAVRPALRRLAGRLGVAAILVLGVLVQVAVVEVAVLLTPGARIDSLATTVATLLIVALVGLVTRWLLGAGDADYLVADVLRRGRSRTRRATTGWRRDDGGTGVVIVQMDGLPYGLLRHAMATGDLPTLSRWVRSGTYEAVSWWARVPSTTPASQAGLLHGTNDGIPAFRWYDKGLGRLVVTNRPVDAALVEAGLTDGKGLLAEGGVSICTMFTGDAPTSLIVMSRAGRHRDLGPGGDFVRFFARPFVFARALLLTLGEMVKEMYQGRRQRVRGIEPRIRRKGSYVALRGVTNAALRDLNVALVAEHMVRGAPVIFVDFVDYDEIAHHAGVARREAVDALAGIDATLSTLERVAAAVPRAYRFVVLSDHGQSQGPTFRQVSGRTLEEVVRALVGPGEGGSLEGVEDVESWGPVNALLTEVLGAAQPTARWAGRRSVGTGMVVGPRGAESSDPREQPTELVVAASGCLGLVWFPQLRGRVPLEVLHERFPALVPGLLAEPGVGFVVVDSARGPLAVGRSGVHVLRDGSIEGADPLGPFGPRASSDLARVAAMANCPDVLVHSTWDERTSEVHAFEELVGSHGGLGGEQNRAVLVHPADWPIDGDLLDRSVPGESLLYGADAVHRQLVRWLERAGARSPGLGRPGTPVTNGGTAGAAPTGPARPITSP